MPPVIHLSAFADEVCKLDRAIANDIIRADIFVKHSKMDIVTYVLDVDFHNLVGPSWSLPSVLLRLGTEPLHTGLDDHVGVHLAHRLCVVSQPGFEDADL